MSFFKYLFSFTIISFIFFSCGNDAIDEEQNTAIQNLKIVDVTSHDGHPFDSGSGQIGNRTYTGGPGGGIMMQAFYWDVPAGGTWWGTVEAKIEDWSNAGIEAIWLPPVSKAQNGPFRWDMTLMTISISEIIIKVGAQKHVLDQELN